MNRHLNVFHHYDQKGSLPIENNVSRGLAILLQEEPTLLYMLLSEIRKAGVNMNDPTHSYEVDIQVPCSRFGDYTKVVGIALTAAELPENFQQDNIVPNGKDPITDISIAYDDTLIIIEVKRTGEDCRAQLGEQIEHYKQGKVDLHCTIASSMAELTWKDVTQIVKHFISMKGDSTNRLIRDYYKEITLKYPTWSPLEPLSKLDVYEEARIKQRLDEIKDFYLSEFDKTQNKRGHIPIDFVVARDCDIEVKRNFAAKDGIGDYFRISIWPGDTSSQSIPLLNAMKEERIDKDFFADRYSELVLSSGEKIKLKILPYIKIAFMGTPLVFIWGTCDDRSNYIDELLKLGIDRKVNGRWKRKNTTDEFDEFDNFEELVTTSTLFSDDQKAQFSRDFRLNLKKTKRLFFDASIAIEISAYMTYAEAQAYDKDADSSKLTELIHDVLTALKAKLE